MIRAGLLVQQAYMALENYPEDPEYDAVLADVVGRAHEADVIVAVDHERGIVGCLTFVPAHDNSHAEFDDEEAAGFRYFGVDPAMQGRGVGDAMVAWVIEEAARLGRRRVRIHTLDIMQSAQRLYVRTGFERDPANDHSVDGIELLAFVKHLR